MSVTSLEYVLHPGESSTNIIPLNHWASMNEPGGYEVRGAFVEGFFSTNPVVRVRAGPISITVLPRTQEEMHEYIKGLTNQIAARLPIQPRQNGGRYDPVLNNLLEDLMYTCSPKWFRLFSVSCMNLAPQGTTLLWRRRDC